MRTFNLSQTSKFVYSHFVNEKHLQMSTTKQSSIVKLIFKREFLSRVRNRSFIVMAIIGPLLMAAVFIVPLWLSKLETEDTKIIAVIDESQVLAPTLKSRDNVRFDVLENMSLEEAQTMFAESGYYAVLFIPRNILNSNTIQLFSNRNPDFGMRLYIAKLLEKDLESMKLVKFKVPSEILKAVQSPLNVQSIKWTDAGQELQTTDEIKMIIGSVSAILIYMFIFMYGAMVMRGVVEEKVNRIVEIVVSSVRPFQLMIGKIAGIGAAGLLQFAVWVTLTFTVVTASQYVLFPEQVMPTKENPTAQTLGETKITQSLQALGSDQYAYAIDVWDSVRNVNWPVMLGAFLFFFVFGFLLYAALYAAIGSAVDSETDTQQFMLPVTIPLTLSVVLLQVVLSNPDGSIAFWLSVIPFTAPVAMMARIPYGVPYNEVLISMLLLMATFVVVAWAAAKIYRTGILMYGKKTSYRELWRWLRY